MSTSFWQAREQYLAQWQKLAFSPRRMDYARSYDEPMMTTNGRAGSHTLEEALAIIAPRFEMPR
ncbi:MAG TPA: hypothetical protein VK395_34970 [Gemmataceae bacterium]|nr:hypothetical protein [Gemmataceae bacterium]